MNHYALFFLTLISLHISNVLSESTLEQIQEKLKQKFEKKFDKVVPTQDLSVEQQNVVVILKNKCCEKMLNNPFIIGSSNYEPSEKTMQRQIAICIAKHAQGKTEDVIDKNIIDLQNAIELSNSDEEQDNFIGYPDQLEKGKQKIAKEIYERFLHAVEIEDSTKYMVLFNDIFERSIDRAIKLALKKQVNQLKRLFKILYENYEF